MRVLRLWKGIVAAQTGILKGLGNVRFGSISLKKSGSKSEHRPVKLTARSTAGLICCQAGFRFGIGISFASLRRF
jgi:hypothetical protein